MPRRSRLIKERAKRKALEILENPRTKTKGGAVAINITRLHVRDLARVHTVALVDQLINIANRSRREENRLKAIEMLLERGYGKPSQSHVGGDPDENPIRHVHETRRTIVRPKG